MRRSVLIASLVLLLMSVAAVLRIAPQIGNDYTPDSHAYILLGRSLFAGHGFAEVGIRDLYRDPQFPLPSRAFPPLYPLIVGTIDWITGAGLNAGAWFNLLLIPILGALFALIGRRTAGERGMLLGVVAFGYVLIVNHSFQEEFAAARAIPIATVFYYGAVAILLAAFSAAPPRRLACAGAGALLGAMILSRFDGMTQSAALVLALLLFPATRRSFPFVIAGAAVVLFPWYLRNFLVFGTPLAAHQSLNATSNADGINPLLNYWAQMPSTLFTDPLTWISLRWKYLNNITGVLFRVTSHLCLLLPVAALCWKRLTPVLRFLLVLAILQTASVVFGLALAGYPDDRYISTSHGLIALVASGLLATATAELPALLIGGVTIATALAVLVLGSDQDMIAQTKATFLDHRAQDLQQSRQAWWDQLMVDYNKVLPLPQETVFASPFHEWMSYYTGHYALYLPNNSGVANPDFFAFVRHWKVQFLVLDRQDAHNRGFDEHILINHPSATVLVDVRYLLSSPAGP